MTHIKSRITREKKIVELMIRLYCKSKEGHKELCPECQALLEYAHTRLDRCPFGEKKSTCRLCTVHCYKPGMRKCRAQNDASSSHSSHPPLGGRIIYSKKKLSIPQKQNQVFFS